MTRVFMYQVVENPSYAAQILTIAKNTLSDELYEKVKTTIDQLRKNFANAEELRRAWRSNPNLFQPSPSQTPQLEENS